MAHKKRRLDHERLFCPGADYSPCGNVFLLQQRKTCKLTSFDQNIVPGNHLLACPHSLIQRSSGFGNLADYRLPFYTGRLPVRPPLSQEPHFLPEASDSPSFPIRFELKCHPFPSMHISISAHRRPGTPMSPANPRSGPPPWHRHTGNDTPGTDISTWLSPCWF